MTLDLGVVYVQEAGRLAGWFRRRVRSEELAEDLVADTFEKALRYVDRYEERGQPVFAWLVKVARSVLIDYIRRQQPEATVLELERPAAAEVAVVAALSADVVDPQIVAALRRLPEAQGQAIVLRYLYDLTTLQIAQRMGNSHSAVSQLCARGMVHLRQDLPDWSPHPQIAEGLDALIDEALRARAARSALPSSPTQPMTAGNP